MRTLRGTILAATIALFLALGAKGEATRAIELNTSCNETNGWRFAVSRFEREAGLEEFEVELSRDAEAQPPTFDAWFNVSGADAHNCWVPYYEANERSRLYAIEWGAVRYESEIGKNLPVCCAFNEAGDNKLLVAASECMRNVRYAITCRSTDCRLEARFRFFTKQEVPCRRYKVRILADRRPRHFSEAVADSVRWIERTAGLSPCRVPEAAFDPIYSSWYAFWQDVHADVLEREASIAAKLGMKTMILDDGWQKSKSKSFYSATCDWRPAADRFPDFRAHVDKVHAAGISNYMLWLSVPYVGTESAAYAKFEKMSLRRAQDWIVLDPRFPEVRRYLVDTYVRCVRDWDFDGLKLDFIDSIDCSRDPAMADGWAGRDCKTIPDGIDRLMKEVRSALVAVKPDVLLEFRQRYTGPAIRQYGNMLRANDCPSDILGNRRRIIDLRLASGNTAVHSDMLVWSPEDTVEDAARVILNALFGVIQYSMRLESLPSEQCDLIRHWIGFTQRHREALLMGSFRPHHPELMYPVVEAWNDSERIVAVYGENQVVDARRSRELYVVNASHRKGVAIRFDKGAFRVVELFDALGRPVGEFRPPIDGGLADVPIPECGYAAFR